MRNFNRVILLAAALFVFAMILTVISAAADGATVKSEAQVVADLGILKGDGNGVTAAYLQKSTTRMQAAIMQLRLKGLEAEALAYNGTDNFTDAKLAGSGNLPILAYLKANPQLGWQGGGSGAFDPLAGITVQQYYKVMLETLGYKQGMDFEYGDAINFAAGKGLSKIAHAHHFINSDIATATIEALKANINGGGKTLAVELSDQKVIDPAKLVSLQYTQLTLQYSAAMGNFLADADGRTLYYFTKDAADLNSCVGGCLAAWPVYYQDKLMVPAEFAAADFGVFVRADGSKQSTYKGWPLYYYAKDANPGDAIGDNVGKVWFVIKPSNEIAIGTKTDLGNYLTDGHGRTLYYFDKDTKGVSNCSGGCLANWPAFYAPNIAAPTGLNSKDFGTLTRTDGTKQTTYKGFALYYWIKDVNHGDTTGQGVGKVWFVVDPLKFSGTTAVAPTPKPTPSPTPAPTPASTPKPTPAPAPTAAAKTYHIEISNYAFSQPVLTVEVGSTVIWTNKDPMQHNAVAVDGTFALPLLSQGESGSYTFTKAGEYDYYCQPHKAFMKGKIIVK